MATQYVCANVRHFRIETAVSPHIYQKNTTADHFFPLVTSCFCCLLILSTSLVRIYNEHLGPTLPFWS